MNPLNLVLGYKMEKFLCSPVGGDEPRQSESTEPKHPEFHHGSQKPSRFTPVAEAPLPAKVPVPSSVARDTALASPLAVEVPELSLDELKAKTDNFSSKYYFGEGTYGNVYVADLDGKQVTIKFLDAPSQPKLEGGNEFLAQLVSTALRLRHANLVELLGYSVGEDMVLLVYEQTTMGSLHDVLHGISQFAAVAARCLLSKAGRRPSIAMVVRALCPLLYLPTKRTPPASAASKHQLTRSKEV